MGSQGNYPGSGAIPQHKYLAMEGHVPGGTSNVDEHLKEGTPSGRGAHASGLGDAGFSEGTDVGIVGENISFPSGAGDRNVRGNIP